MNRNGVKFCPDCGEKLIKKHIQDFGKMVFIECRNCDKIWDYTSEDPEDKVEK